MSVKTYKTKLNVKAKVQREALKAMSGAYRAIFNAGIDIQQKVLHFNASRGTKSLVSGKSLYYHFRDRSSKLFPYIRGLDKGILAAACFHASSSFKRWWDSYSSDSKYRQPKHLAKKDLMHFRTDGNVRVFYNYIEVPKVGKIKLFEGGYIPQGKKYTNVTFSHDGNDWYISLVALDEEQTKKEKLQDTTVVVDFTKTGDLVVDNEVIPSIVTSLAFRKEVKKHKQLAKKLRRQERANTYKNHNGVSAVKTSKNMLKTKVKLTKVHTRMDNMRKDQFQKVANVVAIAKPKKLLALSDKVISKERQGGLTRIMREKHTLDFFNMILKKFELMGTKIVRHKSFLRFKNTASGLGVKTACGELVSTQFGETTNSVKQELRVA